MANPPKMSTASAKRATESVPTADSSCETHLPAEPMFPLRVEDIFSISRSEWRPGETLATSLCETWQMVYVADGAVEETADLRTISLRRGWVFFHQPGETISMRAVGDLPPEVIRVEFACSGPAMDVFRAQLLRTDSGDRAFLLHLSEAARELFVPSAQPGMRPALRPEPLFAARQRLCNILELLLIGMARRLRSGRKLTSRARREHSQNILFEAIQLYFTRNLSRELTVEEVCRENGCTRAGLQKLFRSRAHQGAMEYFAALRVERAKELLASGCTSGETATRLGYSSGAYFSRCFRRATGQSPREYQANVFGLSRTASASKDETK